MTKLLPDWCERLDRYIDDVRGVPFNWQYHNCATFTNNAYRAMTGVGICDDLIGEPANMAEARVVYNEAKRRGKYQDVIHILDDRLTRTFRWPERGMFVARPTAKMATGFALGICVANESAFVGLNGLEMVPVDGSELTWLA